MSQAHKGSRLILSGNVIATNFNSFYADYEVDTSAILGGNLVLPTNDISEIQQYAGKFGNAIGIDQGTTNLWTGAMNIYNNFAPNGQMGASLTALNETFLGQSIYQLQMTPYSSNALSDLQNNLSSHGVMGSSMTYHSANTYIASIYWRPHKSDMVVGGTASNISGWSDVGTIKLNDGWYRSSAKWSHASGDETDYKFWSFKSPSTQLNETVVIDWVCPQIEKNVYASTYTATNRSLGKLWYPSNALNPNTFTISMWFYIPYMHQVETTESYSNDGIAVNWYHPIIEYCPTSNRGVVGYSICAGPNSSSFNRQLRIRCAGPNITSDQVGNISIQDNTWYHLGATYDGSTYSVYLNGTLYITLANCAPPQVYSDTLLMIGGGYFGNPNIFIEDVWIDNEIAHTQEDIQSWYISERPLYNPWDYRSFAF